MAGIPEQLQRCLADRYRFERVLGSGGMATVYLAQDLKHDREVALKVLRPELSAILGSERFLREIRVTARLQHPHIVPLLDSGEAAGLLYYVMPHVRGESLRQRLQREGQLPLETALHIARGVAATLEYAHEQGIIHRDIKPENLLLFEDEPVVADFGIAHVLDVAAGERLTETGLALGTPAYMSPEQAAGSGRLDGRSDVYSLGCVLYEVLVGEPPFTGPTAQAILARHSVDPVRPLRTVRATVPESVEQAVMKALAKVPADRFASASQFAQALGGTLAAVPPPRLARRRRAIVLASAAALGLAGAAIAAWWPRSAVAVDPKVVAILPFHVSGDTSLNYLREGMLDLLQAKLNGEGGPRAVSSNTMLSAWRHAAPAEGSDLPEEAAMQVARNVGAGRLLLGRIVGSRAHLVLNATLLAVPGGRIRTEGSVEGPPDSLTSLVDQLVVQLLARTSGAPQTRLAELSSTTPAALRSYLAGQAAYRRGNYAEANQHFDRALVQDTGFVLAGLGRAMSGIWTDDESSHLAVVWRARARLNPSDRTLVDALAGPRYPAEPSGSEMLAAWKRAIEAAPDRPESWVGLGDVFFHQGSTLGVPAWRDSATTAFRRALEFDSTAHGPLEHLLELAGQAGDTAAVRELGGRLLGSRPFPSDSDRLRWVVASALNDTISLAKLRARLESMEDLNLGFIWLGAGFDDVERITPLLQRRWTSREGRLRLQGWLHERALNRGRPAAALAAAEMMTKLEVSAQIDLRRRVLDALYWEGDSVAGAQAQRRLTTFRAGPPARDGEARAQRYDDLCVAEQWNLRHGDRSTVREAIMLLRAPGVQHDSPAIVPYTITCAALLESILAAQDGRSDALLRLNHLDSLLRADLPGPPLPYANLVVSRLLETRGNATEALAALRRRAYMLGVGRLYLSTYLREEGRLAALTGDREGAISAYRQYLALRVDPEPQMRPEVDQVRGELSRLLGEHGR